MSSGLQTFWFATMLLLASCTVLIWAFAGRPDGFSSLTALGASALLPAVVARRQRRTARKIAIILALAWLLLLVVYR